MPITVRSSLPVVVAIFCHLIAQECSGETPVQPVTLKYTSKGHAGLWCFYPIDREFMFMAGTVADLGDGWCSGRLAV